MQWIRHNWVAIVFILAVIFVFVDGRQRDAETSDAAAAGCVRNSERVALDIAFDTRASEARLADPGFEKTGEEYGGIAEGKINTLPPAEDRHVMTEIEFFVDEQGEYAARLTPEALQAVKDACERAY